MPRCESDRPAASSSAIGAISSTRPRAQEDDVRGQADLAGRIAAREQDGPAPAGQAQEARAARRPRGRATARRAAAPRDHRCRAAASPVRCWSGVPPRLIGRRQARRPGCGPRRPRARCAARARRGGRSTARRPGAAPRAASSRCGAPGAGRGTPRAGPSPLEPASVDPAIRIRPRSARDRPGEDAQQGRSGRVGLRDEQRAAPRPAPRASTDRDPAPAAQVGADHRRRPQEAQ